MSELLLLGSTELTLAIANDLAAAPRVRLAGIVSAPEEFRISYSSTPVRNSRHVDMAGWCREHGVPFTAYTAPADIAAAATATGARAALLAGWYHFVPAAVRAAFPIGCLGLHASLLPRYRGGAPLTWAMLNGDRVAGISLFALSDGVDDGPLFDQREFAVAADDYIADVVAKAESAALEMLRSCLADILAGRAVGRAQTGTPSYGLQRQPSDGVIDWRGPAAGIVRLVRAVSRPYPGARTYLGDRELIIWRAAGLEGAPIVHGVPGQIVRLRELPGPAVITGDGLVLIEEVEGPDGFDRDALARAHQLRLDFCAR